MNPAKNNKTLNACSSSIKQHRELFQRVWEYEDETKLLKALRDYSQKGGDALMDMSGFIEFSINKIGKFSKAQLKDKVHRLKKKYENNFIKEQKACKSLTFKMPHEEEVFLISKDIWGDKLKGAKGKDSHAKETEVEYAQGGEVTPRKTKNGRRGETENPIVLKDGNNVEIMRNSMVSVKETCERVLDELEVVEKWLGLADPSQVRKLQKRQTELEGMILKANLKRLKFDIRKTRLALEVWNAAKLGGGKP